jgi:hypothetical protein
LASRAQLILKRAPIGWGQDDYDVLEDGVIIGRRRAATTATYAAQRNATKRRVKARWRRLSGVGTEKHKRAGCQGTAIAGIPT